MPFYFSFYGRGTYVALFIEGDFRAGSLLMHFYPFVQALANLNKGKMSIVLEDVIYMDSESMNLIKDLSDRCVIEWNVESHVYKRYQEKFPLKATDEN